MKDGEFIVKGLVMIYNRPVSDKFISQGYRNLTRGSFIFGGILFLLALLIFAYPALVAYFIASVILLAGISILAVAWKLWRIRSEVSQQINKWDPVPVSGNRGTRIIYFRWVA